MTFPNPLPLDLRTASSGHGRLLAGVLLTALAAGCGGPKGTPSDGAPRTPPDLSTVSDAIPRAEPPSRYGNPRSYEVWGNTYYTSSTSRGYRERGEASWYGTKFHGRRTSSGERYDMYAMTAAHKSLPLPVYVQVTNLRNGRAVVVKVNDRGPFHGDRIIDLSYAAAAKLGFVDAGTAPVEVVALPPHQTLRRDDPLAAKVATGRQPAVEPIPAGNMYLQVGAFADRANAQRMLVELDSGLPGRVRIHELVGSDAVYRVRIGPLSDAEATRVRRELGSMGITEAIVVFEEQM